MCAHAAIRRRIGRAGPYDAAQIDNRLRDVDDVDRLELSGLGQTFRRDADAIADEKRILRLRSQCQRQIDERAHVALRRKRGPRHRETVREEFVDIRLARDVGAQIDSGFDRTFADSDDA